MADTLQKLKNSVNKGITTISVKTSSTLEKSKIKMHIESLEKELQKVLISIGEEAYEIWSNGSADFEALTEKFEDVTQRRNEIQKLAVELDSIDDRDNEILGKSKEVAPVEPVESKLICPNCGSQYDAPVNFCRKCGYNFKNK